MTPLEIRRWRWRLRKQAQRLMPNPPPCRCGARAQRHHPDPHRRPKWIVPLCQRCHAGLHIRAGTWATMGRSRA